jgi:acyl carrier protein
MNDIQSRVISVIEMQARRGGVTLDDHIRTTLEFDSLDVVELVIGLEEEFDVEISDQEVMRLPDDVAVRDVVEFMERKLVQV